MTGDYGEVEIKQYVNSDFISVVAGPGQTPLVRSLRLASSSHWLFRGIKFQSLRPEKDLYGPMVGVGLNAFSDPPTTSCSQPTPSRQQIEQRNGVPRIGSRNRTRPGWSHGELHHAFHNHFFNLRDAVGIGSPRKVAWSKEM